MSSTTLTPTSTPSTLCDRTITTITTPLCDRTITTTLCDQTITTPLTSQFVKKSMDTYGPTRFDYSAVEYVNDFLPITLLCNLCKTLFTCLPIDHFSRAGCIVCFQADLVQKMEEFIKAALKLYKGIYTYDKVDLGNVGNCGNFGNDKVQIYCTICSDYFYQLPSTHLKAGGRCDNCKLRNKCTYNLDDFVKKSNKIHKNKYSYVKSVFKTISTPLIIICLECNQEFTMSPTDHNVNIKGCPNCKTDGKKKEAYEQFLKDAKGEYGDAYSYEKSNFVNKTTPITIIHVVCEAEFSVSPNDHINLKRGCPQCKIEDKIQAAHEKQSTKVKAEKESTSEIVYNGTYDIQFFISDAKEIHRGKYSYEKSIILNLNTKILIICNECLKEFWQRPDIHLKGSGCSYCVCSQGEKSIYDFLDKIGFTFKFQHKFEDCKDKNKLPFDFYIPDYDLLIEYNGQQHYEPIERFGGEEAFKSQKRRDKIKYDYCISKKYDLLEIKYDENPIDKLKEYFESKGIWDDIDPDNPDNN